MRRLAVLALLLVGLATPAHAEDLAFSVNALTDLPDSNVGDGLCAAQDGHCSLRAAVEESAKRGGAAKIAVPAGTIALATPLAISTAVTITGRGAATVLDATASTSAMTVSLASLTLNQLSLRGGTSVDGGGSAINASESSLTLSHVQIASAHSGFGGGAVQVAGGSVTMDGVTIHDSDGADGAAVHAVSTAVTIKDSTFARNTATANGGALFLSYPRSLSLTGSTFQGNSTFGKGGAIYLEGRARGAKDLLLTGTFSDNSARGAGGAVFVRTTSNGISDAVLTLDKPVFKDNAGGIGGALGIDDGRVTITGGTFTANRARSGGGGAIAAAGELTVADSTFTANGATEAGGAISSLGLAKITGTTFSKNFSGTTGGALALQGYAMPSVESSPFQGNVAAGGASAIWRGGAGLTQKANTLETGQEVVVDAPPIKAEKVSLTDDNGTSHRRFAIVAGLAGLLILLLGLDVRSQLRRRKVRS